MATPRTQPDPPPQLREPTESLREAYLDFAAEFAAAGEKGIAGSGAPLGDDFAAFVTRLRDFAGGRNLQADWVPATTYWLVRGGRVLGTCTLRHRLTDSLRDCGGHIGYAVRPSERGKGYATLQLRLMLEKARRLGLDRVLLTCDKTNTASARVIQKCGGVLGSESHSPAAGRVTSRYWIVLG